MSCRRFISVWRKNSVNAGGAYLIFYSYGHLPPWEEADGVFDDSYLSNTLDTGYDIRMGE